MPVRGLTSYRGFGHHGGNILWPVEWNGTSHLDVGGVAPCCERHDWGVMDNLLRLNLVSYIPLGDKDEGKKKVSIPRPSLGWNLHFKLSLLFTPTAKKGFSGKSNREENDILIVMVNSGITKGFSHPCYSWHHLENASFMKLSGIFTKIPVD